MILASLVLAEALALACLGGLRDGGHIRAIGLSANMLLVAVFGPLLVSFGAGVTNIGVIFITAAVATQIIILERSGVDAARSSVPRVYFLLGLVLLMCSLLGRLPTVEGNEVFAAAARIVMERNASIIVASVAAFAISQMALILLYQRFRGTAGFWPTAIGGMLICHCIDTPIFFVVAFWNDLGPRTLDLAMAGLAAKVSIGLLLMPSVAFAVARSRANSEGSTLSPSDLDRLSAALSRHRRA